MTERFSKVKNYFSKISSLFRNKFFYAGVFLTATAVIFSFGAAADIVSFCDPAPGFPCPDKDPVDGSNDVVSPSPSPDIFYISNPNPLYPPPLPDLIYGMNPVLDIISGTGGGDYPPPLSGKGNLVIIKSTQIGDSSGPGGVWKFTIVSGANNYQNTVNVYANNQGGRGEELISDLAPGLYNLSENNNPEPGTFNGGAGAWLSAPGWGWGCAFASKPNVAANTVGDLGNPELAIIEEGDTTICVFSNRFTSGQETGILQIATRVGPRPWEIWETPDLPIPARYYANSKLIGEGNNILSPGSYDITVQISDRWELTGVSCPEITYNYGGGDIIYPNNIVYNLNDVMISPLEARIGGVPIPADRVTLCVFSYYLKQEQVITPDTGFLKINKRIIETGENAGFKYAISPFPFYNGVVVSTDIITSGLIGSSKVVALKDGHYDIKETVLPGGWSQYWEAHNGETNCKVVGNGTIWDPDLAISTQLTENNLGGVKIYAGKTTECTFTNLPVGTPIALKTKLKIIVETSGGNGDETFQFGGGALYYGVPTFAVKTERVRQDPNTGEWSGRGEWIGEAQKGGGIGILQKYSEGWILNTAKCDTPYSPIVYGNSSGPAEGGVGFGYFAPIYPKDTVTCVFTSTKAAENVPNAGKIRILKFIAADQSGNNQTFNFTTNFGQSPSLTTIWEAYEFEEIFSLSSTDGLGGRAMAEWISKDLSAGPNFKITELPKEGWEIASQVYCMSGGGSGPIGSDGKPLPYIDNAWVWKGVAMTCVFDNQKSDGGGGGGAGKLTIIKKTPNNTDGATFNYSVFPSPSGLSVTTVNGTGTGSNVIASLDSSIKYDVAEGALTGWTPTKAVCQLYDGRNTGSPAANGSSVTGVEIIPGQTTSCVFENEKTGGGGGEGTLIITKNTPGNAGATTFQYFILPGPSMAEVRTVAGIESGSAAITGLDPNTRYSIIESSLPGWTLNKVACQLYDGSDYRSAGNPGAGGYSVADVEISSNPRGATTCVFENTSSDLPPPPPPDTGTLIIAKNTPDNTDVATFRYIVSSSPLRPEVEVVPDVGGDSASGSVSVEDLSSSVKYDITEEPLANWRLTTASCRLADGSIMGELVADGTGRISGIVSVEIVSGKTTTCVFENTKEGSLPPLTDKGKLKIIKNTPGNTSAATFSYTTSPLSLDKPDSDENVVKNSGQNTSSKTIELEVDANGYKITEKELTGWLPSAKPSCTLEGGGTTGETSATSDYVINKVKIVKDQTTTCVFENTKEPPPPPSVGKLKIIKNTPDNTDSATFNYTVSPLSLFESNSIINVIKSNGQETASNTIEIKVDPDGYKITESRLTGWLASAKPSCTLEGGGTTGETSATSDYLINKVKIVKDQTTTCVFENEKTIPPPPPDTGKIKVLKNASGGTGNETFYFATNNNLGLNYIRTSGTSDLASGNWISGDLLAGAVYRITELIRSGWALVSVSCDDTANTSNITNGVQVTVVKNKTIICTFTDRK